MSKKALSIVMLLGIVLSACGGQAAEQATETPTAVPATTAPPTLPPTNTPTEEIVPVTGDTPTPLPTPTEFVPDNPSDCVNKATFVTDVTIPDSSNVAAGESFVKTWRVQNAGTCIWWSGYTLTYYSGETLSAPASVPLPATNPGQTADISIDLVAPSVAGKYQGNFVIKNPAGLIMQVDNDSRLWVIINVSGTAASTPAATTASGGDSTAATTDSTSGSGNATCGFTTDEAKTTDMLSALTAYRSQNNLAALPVNAQLSQAAQRHANDMACNQLFYHNGSDGSTPDSRVAATGYNASDVTENVYGSYPPLTGQGVISWWATDQTDPRHNQNLLTTQYTEIGVGYAFFNNYGYYVIVFAKP
jgi:uncharacterized protein YkwD